MTTDGARGPLRAGIIGAGLMGRWHAAAVRRAGHTVSAIHDADTSRARALASACGATSAATIDALLTGVDVVHVCSPLATHVTLASRALASGCAVVCEKPLASRAAEVRGLYTLAATHARLLVPTHQFLFQRGVRDAIRQLPSLGPLLHIDLTACTAGASGRDAAGAEAVALDVLPHPMSLVERVAPGALDAMAWQVADTPPGELRIGGVSGALSIGVLISCGGRPPVNQLRLVAAGGTVMVDLFHGFCVVDRGRASRLGKVGRPFVSAARTVAAASSNLASRALRAEPAYPGLRELVAGTYEAVRTGGPAPIAAPEVIAVADACEFVQAARLAHRR